MAAARNASSEEDEARAMKACLGNQHLEHLVPSLFKAPLTHMQREAMITAWLVPCALALNGAKLAHRLKLAVHIGMHICHGAIAVCHAMGAIITWNGFAIIGIALAATASTLVGLQHWVADAKHLETVGDDLLHIGTHFFSNISKEVSEERWVSLIDELLTAKQGAGTKTAPRAATAPALPALPPAAKASPTSSAATTKVELDA